MLIADYISDDKSSANLIFWKAHFWFLPSSMELQWQETDDAENFAICQHLPVFTKSLLDALSDVITDAIFLASHDPIEVMFVTDSAFALT